MSSALILLLGLTTAAPIRWARLAGGGLVEFGRVDGAEGLSTLAGLAAGSDTVAAILPGEQAALRRLPSPPKSEAKFRSAAAYLLEDELAEPIDALHVAIDSRDGQGLAIAARKSVIEAWLGAFASAGVAPTVLTADYLLLLQSSADEGTLVFEGGRVVAAGGASGFAAETELFEHVRAAAPMTGAGRLTAFGDRAHVEAMLHGAMLDGATLDWAGPADDATLLGHYGALLEEHAPPNLLQGAYRRRRAFAPAFAPWRRSAALLAASLAALAVFAVADGFRSARTADRLEQVALAAHRSAFPEAAAEDPARHARRVLGAGAGGGSFLSLASRFAEAAEADGRVQIDRISYDAARGQMIVSVRSSSDVDIEALKTRLAEKGVTARDNGGYRRSGAFWIGELAAAAP